MSRPCADSPYLRRLEEEKAGLETRLAEAEKTWALREAMLVGPPVGWDRQTPAGFGRGEIEQAMEEILRSCPEVDPQRLHLDCEEYPCLLWVRDGMLETDPASGTGMFDRLRGCPAWPPSAGPSISMFATQTGDGQLELAAIPMSPRKDESEAGALVTDRRLEFRMQVGQDIVRELWSGGH